MLPTSIGYEIKIARKNKGLSQEDLGKLLNVGKRAISHYEKGDTKIIPFSTRKKLSEILDINLAHLLYADELTCNTISAFLSLSHQQNRQAIFTTDKFMLLDLWFYKSKPENIEWLNYFATLVLIGISGDEFDKIKTYIEFLRSQRQKTPPTPAADPEK